MCPVKKPQLFFSQKQKGKFKKQSFSILKNTFPMDKNVFRKK
ncbi:hypothetical protein X474_08725 [Dethiosulfatarculus sandiegensis]|uniref:Uncharacterized protein n=1 Tax=Dethiosulfatarculus sandiegensis TaxID=1429043 RepID=A0A0D2JXM3_9BACT|nr:hypothetical protein X474_08725 [Dethiosulfatarculus sandiegensis]